MLDTTSPTIGSGGFMAALDDDERAALLALGRRRHYRPGTTILREGDPSDHLLLIAEGHVKVWRTTEDGREVVLAVGSAGDLYGEVAGLEARPRSASVTAVGKVEAIAIPVPAFRSFLAAHPETAYMVLAVVNQRLRAADEIRAEFGGHDALRRVASRIIDLLERFGEPAAEGVRIAFPITQKDLAGWTGSSRESVNKVLTAMRNRGWIQTHRRGLTVTDPDAVARCAS